MNTPFDLEAARDSLNQCSADELRVMLESRGFTAVEVFELFPSKADRISALLTVEADTHAAALNEQEKDDPSA